MTEHRVTYTKEHPDILVFTCTAECSCGWAFTATSCIPSDAAREALLQGLPHKTNNEVTERESVFRTMTDRERTTVLLETLPDLIDNADAMAEDLNDEGEYELRDKWRRVAKHAHDLQYQLHDLGYKVR